MSKNNKITKAECLEFLQTNRINGKKNEHVYGLFVLVEKLNNKWPDSSDEIPINNWLESYKFGADPQRYMEINGYTPREFGRMVWAKNEIKRRENVRKTQKEEWARHMQYGKQFQRRCVVVPVISDPKPESGSSNNILQRPFLTDAQQEFQSKALAQKVGGGKVAGIGRGVINSPSWGGIDWAATEKAYEASKLKAEQEEKKMRDSNAELKEGDKVIVNNDQGFIVSYGAELIGLEVEIVKFFSQKDIELAAVECNGSVYCFRKSMLKPVKTERQKAIEFYLSKVSMGMVQSVYKANEKYYGFAIESLIDSGYLNTKIPMVAR